MKFEASRKEKKAFLNEKDFHMHMKCSLIIKQKLNPIHTLDLLKIVSQKSTKKYK